MLDSFDLKEVIHTLKHARNAEDALSRLTPLKPRSPTKELQSMERPPSILG